MGDEVRSEADEIEPSWSQVIWRQAMQYHNMLKQKHEMEQKAAAETAAKKKAIEERVNAAKRKIKAEEDEKKAAERAAKELIAAEERERDSKTAFSDGTVKKFPRNEEEEEINPENYLIIYWHRI